MAISNTNAYNRQNLYIDLKFVNSPNKNRAGSQADVTVTALASFALIMAAEAVETSAAANFPPEILTSLSSSGNYEIYSVYAYIDMDNPFHTVYFYCIFTSMERSVLNSHLQLHLLVDI